MKTYQVPANTPMPEELLLEWESWLKENCDPGHYDAYKVDGEWQVDTDMPEHIYEKLAAYNATKERP